MLNTEIQQKILSVLHGHVYSTSMVARKTQLSRITVSKYLSAMETKGQAQAVRIGKAVAWRSNERKPVVAIMAKTGIARIVKLSLGERYSYSLTTNPSQVRDAFMLVTDNIQYARTSEIPVVLIGQHSEEAYSLPELFDTSVLKVLAQKIYYEQYQPITQASASIVIEHFDELEEALGIHAADELLKLTVRMLRENRVSFKQFERTTFLIDGNIAEGVLVDIEQTFHLILAHTYGKMVLPGELTSIDTEDYRVPSLTITLAEPRHLDALEHR